MVVDLSKLPLEDLLRKFAAGGHKPGSGSAAALLGLISCALTKTVIGLSKERDAYKSVWTNIDKRFLSTGDPGLMSLSISQIKMAAQGNPQIEKDIIRSLKEQEIRELWRLLAVLPRSYEDVCREWFLPTALSYMSARSNFNSNDDNAGQVN